MKHFQSGHYIDHGCYKSFSPGFINRAWQVDDMELIVLLGEASRRLGRLEAYFRLQDAEDVEVQHFKDEGAERVEAEVAGLLERLPFSARLIKEVHVLLGQEGRGRFKVPGTYRSSQSWTCSLSPDSNAGGHTEADTDASAEVFVPPYPTEIPELMSDWEKFANNHYVPLPDLVRLAIVYYQFHVIHPFWEGNEEVGRWIVPLYLMSMDMLPRPFFDLSDYFEEHKDLYFEHLTRVRTHNDMAGWVKFFLEGVIETARRKTEGRAEQTKNTKP